VLVVKQAPVECCHPRGIRAVVMADQFDGRPTRPPDPFTSSRQISCASRADCPFPCQRTGQRETVPDPNGRPIVHRRVIPSRSVYRPVLA
jgi:hypothetical protein